VQIARFKSLLCVAEKAAVMPGAYYDETRQSLLSNPATLPGTSKGICNWY
jgi:hypothetical protein